MSLLRLKALAAKDLSAASLIDEVFLPLMERGSPDRFSGQSGWLSMEISGEKGGEWSIDLDASEVFFGAHPDPDCHLQMNVTIFGDLLRGRLNAQQALDEGTLHVHGDPDLLIRLSELLAATEE